MGCLELPAPTGHSGEGTTVQSVGTGCGPLECGNSNSPEIDNQGIHDFDSTFVQPNDAGFLLTGYSKDGISYTPVVDRATLTGQDGFGHVLLHDGGSRADSLIGSQFSVVHTQIGREYLIQIDGVGSAPYFAKPGGVAMTTPTYFISWIVAHAGRPEAGATWANICHSPPVDIDTFGMNRFHAVLFEGDRIDAVNKVVYTVDKHWFNIGCAGSALSKQHLDGHTHGAMDAWPAFTTTLDQRTAHLKMLSADYCGAGVPLTIAGQPLNYADDRGWMHYVSSTPVLEARWTRFGASCLNQPRIAAHPSPDAIAAFPIIEVAIRDACLLVGKSRPPPCTGTVTDFQGHHLLSANP